MAQHQATWEVTGDDVPGLEVDGAGIHERTTFVT